MKIKQFDFHPDDLENIENERFGKNWPVTYLLTDDNRLYIGETNNVKNRMSNHLVDKNKKGLQNIHIITADDYNKSVILDLESYLIQRMTTDQKYKVLNSNLGQNRNNDYYQKNKYMESFVSVWNELYKRKLVDNDIISIENSDLFKFSPFKTLTAEQFEVSKELLYAISSNILSGKKETNFIIGGAGTGKSVLAVYLTKALVDMFKNNFSILDMEEFGEDNIYNGLSTLQVEELQKKKLKIGIVISMTSLRKTIQSVFTQVEGLRSNMVISPSEAARRSNFGKEPFDLLIVDEAHRLRRRKAIVNLGAHDEINKKLGLGKDGHELDWIMKCSNNQILFYDHSQSIRTSDIPKYVFDELLTKNNTHQYHLDSQLRVRAGNGYLSYIKKVLYNEEVNQSIADVTGTTYDFQFFDDITKMREAIFERDKELGLSRMISGNSWEWRQKATKFPNYKTIDWKTMSLEKYRGLVEDHYDFEINGEKFLWNVTTKDWINSESSQFEVGSNHTTQGYDLNYAGVIFGKEITYNKKTKTIEVIPKNYLDSKAKQSETIENIQSFIINSYYVFLTRGIRGTYVYVYDEDLREYLKNVFFPMK